MDRMDSFHSFFARTLESVWIEIGKLLCIPGFRPQGQTVVYRRFMVHQEKVPIRSDRDALILHAQARGPSEQGDRAAGDV